MHIEKGSDARAGLDYRYGSGCSWRISPNRPHERCVCGIFIENKHCQIEQSVPRELPFPETVTIGQRSARKPGGAYWRPSPMAIYYEFTASAMFFRK
jgi:hypothetical protein